MDRREFVRLGLVTGAGAVAAGNAAAAGPMPVPAAAAGSPAAESAYLDATAFEQQAAMSAAKLTSAALVSGYLARIAAIDKAGPKINAIIELNPDALAIAKELDRERAVDNKVRGPLHGIPVLLKDNIATTDKMSTSAGSLALAGIRATRDSFVAAQLRAAGAVILGKTNLSEWANLRSTRSTSGWSGRGGLTRNPYALDRNTSGSSSGSGAAMAAGLASLTVGTETDGSIVSPSSINGLVGLKPTVGLVSRSGIIPLSHTQDTAGPMVRTVSDAALLLGVMAGVDPHDAATTTNTAPTPDYMAALAVDGLKGMRIGVSRKHFGRNDVRDGVIEKALQVLQAQGAVLVDPVEIPNTAKFGDSEYQVLLYEFKAGLPAYLANYAPHAPIKNMADLIAYNLKNVDKEMPHFAQEHLVRADAKGGLDSKEYLDALATCRRYARDEGIDQVMKEQKLDALVAPTTGLAWLTDFINGDASGGGFSSPAAVAGYPHITVPAGYAHGLPVGLSFVGTAYTEAKLLRMAYAFEQATLHRRPPTFPASVNRSAGA